MNTTTPNPRKLLSLASCPLPLFSRLATLTLLTLAFLLTASAAFAQVARFEGLGDLPGAGFETWVRSGSISADGSVAVGRAIADNEYQAFRWQGGEIEGLEQPAVSGTLTNILAEGASGDGSVVVGFATVGSFPNERSLAVRWEDGAVEELPASCYESATPTSLALDVSSDGSIAVGRCSIYDPTDGPQSLAVRWVGGEMDSLGYLPGHSNSSAQAISSDGSTIVGTANTPLGANATEVFRWTEDEGMVSLGNLGEPGIAASAVNADGSVVAGYSTNQEGYPTAWRWEGGVMEELPHLSDGIGSVVNDVSADGSIVAGWSAVIVAGDPNPQFRAAIWMEEEDGWHAHSVRAILEEEHDLDLTDWELMYVLAISDDGNVIVGNGTNPDGVWEAWRAEAPFGQPIADEATPEALADVLSAPSPNPASGISTFTIAVEQGQHVSVEVFDALGRQVQTVYEGAFVAGMSESLTLDASALPTGVYMIRATGEDFVKTRNVTVVR